MAPYNYYQSLLSNIISKRGQILRGIRFYHPITGLVGPHKFNWKHLCPQGAFLMV